MPRHCRLSLGKRLLGTDTSLAGSFGSIDQCRPLFDIVSQPNAIVGDSMITYSVNL